MRLNRILKLRRAKLGDAAAHSGNAPGPLPPASGPPVKSALIGMTSHSIRVPGTMGHHRAVAAVASSFHSMKGSHTNHSVREALDWGRCMLLVVLNNDLLSRWHLDAAAAQGDKI